MNIPTIVAKIKQILRGKTSEDQRIQDIELNTKALIQAKVSDVSRWAKNEELFPNWNERTALMGSYIGNQAKVIEFGAGVMHLKQILPETVSYTPSDIVKRYDQTIVCDLNQPIAINLTSFTVAVFSGVLEYVYDIDSIIKQLYDNGIGQIILSYCCSDIVLLSRVKNGWLSDYTQENLEAIFLKYGYQIEDYQLWNNQSIYNLKLA